MKNNHSVILEAGYSPLARWLFTSYIDRIMRKDFNALRLVNLPPKVPAEAGLLLTPNHISWWDGFFADLLGRRFFGGRQIRLMMLEEQLRRYWFFQKAGAFGVNTSSVQGIAASMRYASAQLANPRNFVVVYPQGAIEPFETRVPGIRRGIAMLRAPGALVLPLAARILPGTERKPDAWFRFGAPLPLEQVHSNFAAFTAAFTENRDALAEASSAGITELVL